MEGYDVCITHPKGFRLDPYYLKIAQQYCNENGTNFEIEYDQLKAFENADVIYVKSWGSLKYYGIIPESINEVTQKQWIVDNKKMELTNDALISHCLPLKRNILITDEVLDSKNSLIYEEAENRLHVQKGILEWVRQRIISLFIKFYYFNNIIA